MTRQLRPSFKPHLESLEDRCVPSASPFTWGCIPLPDAPAIHGSMQPGYHHGSVADDMRGGHHDMRVVPFQITGGGYAPGGLPLIPGVSGSHNATGQATFLGKYTGEGTFTLGSLNIDPKTGAVTGTFHGSFVFVAANGDRLAFNYGVGNTGKLSGQISPDGKAVTNVTFDAIFTVDPANCTGRFADVVGGSFRMIAHSSSLSLIPGSPTTAPFNYTWSGVGDLVLGEKK
jgi:hypothetical protein